MGWWFLGVVILLALNRTAVSAAQSSDAGASTLAAEEREGCRRNLKVIYDAIQAYQYDHKEMPNWLSDLVPDYVSDGNTLICLVCRRTGRTEQPPLADPKLACSYVFEFSPVPLMAAGPAELRPTRRDWRRRQMGLVGAVVPVVRCRHHDPILNLAFNGTIYDSPPQWELVFTNRIRASELSVGAIFGLPGVEENPTLLATQTQTRPTTPHRAATSHTVDLSPFYTSDLTQPLQGKKGDDLGALRKGTRNLNGVDFDIRGIIQLGTDPASAKMPSEVKGIPIRQRCQHLYFLHAACVTGGIEAGEQIGAYNVHLSKSDALMEIPIYYGRSVSDWHGETPSSEAEKELKVAWIGQNGLSTQTGTHVRLFLTSWNLAPGVDIESLDFVSTAKQASPFLVAISFD